MRSAANNLEPRIKDIRVTEDQIIADLMDGRTISVPLTWSWRLSDAIQINPRGGELFYISLDDAMMVVPVETTGEFRPEASRKLFDAPGSMKNVGYDVSPDGRRFLSAERVGVPDSEDQSKTTIMVVQSWAREFESTP